LTDSPHLTSSHLASNPNNQLQSIRILINQKQSKPIKPRKYATNTSRLIFRQTQSNSSFNQSINQKPSNRQTVKPSNRQTVKPSNRQTVKPSNRQTIKPNCSILQNEPAQAKATLVLYVPTVVQSIGFGPVFVGKKQGGRTLIHSCHVCV
jgi:hypothetical protein